MPGKASFPKDRIKQFEDFHQRKKSAREETDFIKLKFKGFKPLPSGADSHLAEMSPCCAETGTHLTEMSPCRAVRVARLLIWLADAAGGVSALDEVGDVADVYELVVLLHGFDT